MAVDTEITRLRDELSDSEKRNGQLRTQLDVAIIERDQLRQKVKTAREEVLAGFIDKLLAMLTSDCNCDYR